jgi:hypothetical protein
LQDFADVFRHIAKFKIAVHLPGAGQCAHNGSQTAAVDEYDVAEMQHDRPPIAQQVSDVATQSLRLWARYDAAFATHNRDTTNIASFQ